MRDQVERKLNIKVPNRTLVHNMFKNYIRIIILWAFTSAIQRNQKI